ncbi:hypothetical protein HS125_10595 [bacterium]|nr:hypothetical protein [bacterium]
MKRFPVRAGRRQFEVHQQQHFQYIRSSEEQEELLAAVNQLYRTAGQANQTQWLWLTQDLQAQILVKIGAL